MILPNHLKMMNKDLLHPYLIQKNQIQKAILPLPDKQRQVFNLRYFEEMPYEEISEITGTSVGALKASFHHASEKVRKAVKEEIDIQF